MVFTCYYIILLINCFYSRRSKFFFSHSSLITENMVDVQMFLWLRCIPHTKYGKSIAIERVIFKGIVYREIKICNLHIT